MTDHNLPRPCALDEDCIAGHDHDGDHRYPTWMDRDEWKGEADE